MQAAALALAACSLFQGFALRSGLPPAWVPPANLQRVPIQEDCRRTNHGIGFAVQPSLAHPNGIIFFCPERARNLDQLSPGVSRFFLVHEYGHLALRTRDESEADRWAARQLSSTVGGGQTLTAALQYFAGVGLRFDPYYGTGFDRSWRVAEAGGIDESHWPASLRRYIIRQTALRSAGTTWRLQVKGNSVSANLILTIDYRAIGFLSTRPASELITARLNGAQHSLTAEDIWIYAAGAERKDTSVENHLEARGTVAETGSLVILELDYQPGEVVLRVAGSP